MGGVRNLFASQKWQVKEDRIDRHGRNETAGHDDFIIAWCRSIHPWFYAHCLKKLRFRLFDPVNAIASAQVLHDIARPNSKSRLRQGKSGPVPCNAGLGEPALDSGKRLAPGKCKGKFRLRDTACLFIGKACFCRTDLVTRL